LNIFFKPAAKSDESSSKFSQKLLSSERAKTALSIVGLHLLIGLTIALSHHVSGPNPRDQFVLTLLTSKIDLDESENPTVRFRFLNRSGIDIFLKQFDADYGCRIVMQPPVADLELVDGESCDLECELQVEHDYLLPRTLAENVVPLSICPIIQDSEGNKFAVPTTFFKQVFSHRVISSADIIRLASHPAPNDLITSVRSIVLRPVGNALIESVQISDLQHETASKLLVDVKRGTDQSVIVTVSFKQTLGVDKADSVDDQLASLMIKTTRNGIKDSDAEVRIPIHLRHRWTT